MTTHVAFQSAGTPLGTVSADMFGGNFLIDRDRMDAGTYDEAIADLGLTNLRYPGGSITEWYFDITDPDKTSVWDPDRGEMRDLLPLSTFLAQAAEAGVGVDLVIPTGALLDTGALGARAPAPDAYDAVKTYVADVLAGAYGDAHIVGIEIGNEYWLSGEMTDAEYARIATVIAEAAQAAIDEHRASGAAPAGWEEPEIAVQIGQYGRYSTDPGHLQNDVVMAGLSDAAAAAIDAVVAHYYTWGSYDDLVNFEYYFNRLDSWLEDERFAGIEYHITEWNTSNGRTDETGLKQASTILYMFSEMVAQGVDAAYVWPVQQNNDTNLTGNEGDIELSFAGETFRMLSESVSGMDLVQRQSFRSGAAYVYRDGGETVIFIASRSDTAETFRLDLDALGLTGHYYWTEALGCDGAADDPEAAPLLTIGAGAADAASQARFSVDAYGVMRVTFIDDTSGAAARLPDQIEGSERGDVLTGSAAADTMHGQGGADLITGGTGADRLAGGTGDDTIDGGGQNDRIVAGAGDDLVRGGNGRDRVSLGAGNDIFRDNGQVGVAGADVVFGGAGDDLLAGRAGSDRLEGGDGADTLEGGKGADLLRGNRGSDLLRGGANDDRLVGGAGDDALHGEAGNDTLIGGGGDDRLNGGTGNDEIDAGDGDDVVAGGNGADRIDLGGGDDLFRDTGQTGAAGADIVNGGAGADVLRGQGGSDVLSGGAGADRLSGGAAGDTLRCGADDDLAWGGDGADRVFGDAGDDTLRGGSGNDAIDGGTGNDTLRGDDGDDSLWGQEGDDYLGGWSGDDILHGGHGDDTLIGGTGQDYLAGGAGDDLLIGGAGADTFVFAANDGTDVLSGFEAQDRILIDIPGLAYADLEISVADDGTATLRFAGTGVLIEDLGTDLDATGFLFA
ncbi:calcium-binding protein [Tropicimonas marinistellae]|uniref:calcium-binding protein n=1 Tax=Tropicimonas marinistellae TaxID=1739787 RepID=UPI000831E9AE|nr:calcium-binding protein [Tropicimonas marinistellae]